MGEAVDAAWDSPGKVAARKHAAGANGGPQRRPLSGRRTPVRSTGSPRQHQSGGSHVKSGGGASGPHRPGDGKVAKALRTVDALLQLLACEVEAVAGGGGGGSKKKGGGKEAAAQRKRLAGVVSQVQEEHRRLAQLIQARERVWGEQLAR